jgi:cell wall-associated NlpC family hydrolase
VAVPGQPTPKNKLNYPVWILANQVSLDAGYGVLQSIKPFAIVDKIFTPALYCDTHMKLKYVELSNDTRLTILGTGGLVQVPLPSGGSAYLPTSDLTLYDTDKEIPYPTKEALVSTAKMFVAHPYLWGGTSRFAFNCSGCMDIIYMRPQISPKNRQ